MGDMQSWEDKRMEELRQEFPGWDVWYIRHAMRRVSTWCARPKGAPVAIFHAWKPDELAVKLRTAETEVGKP